MAYSRYIAVAMLFSLVFPAACSKNTALWDPAAQSGASSEEIWYRYGGARVAYTAVARPKQLSTGHGAVQDPALYGQAPATQKVSPKKRSAPKPVTAPKRPPECPPCPPADAATSASHNASSQASPAFSAPAQGATRPVPPPPAPSTPSAPGVPSVTGVPGPAGVTAPPPSPPKIPLPGMPAAIPAPIAPGAPGG